MKTIRHTGATVRHFPVTTAKTDLKIRAVYITQFN
jgi:hypothetical protein